MLLMFTSNQNRAVLDSLLWLLLIYVTIYKTIIILYADGFFLYAHKGS